MSKVRHPCKYIQRSPDLHIKCIAKSPLDVLALLVDNRICVGTVDVRVHPRGFPSYSYHAANLALSQREMAWSSDRLSFSIPTQ
jgi:hypothetical protein